MAQELSYCAMNGFYSDSDMLTYLYTNLKPTLQNDGTIHTVWVGSAEFFSFLGLLLSPFSLRLPLGMWVVSVGWESIFSGQATGLVGEKKK
ncbi:unnamed protein product [Rhizophagus irregularis]|nr:unnamed protein product [Rhizophagus irregularis]